MTAGRRALLGVDVASRLKNIGVAAGVLDEEGRVHVTVAAVGASDALPGRATGPTTEAAAHVAAWLAEQSDGPVTLGLDAPLGWPRSLALGLAEHAAGDAIPATDGPDRLWRRVTDLDVHARFGKLPLEVGANYIARAAWSGLEILRRYRELRGAPVPVPLAPGPGDAALETYPAATLRSWLGEDPGSYKAKDPGPRVALLDRLIEVAPLTVSDEARAAALAVDHVFDAVVCVLAAGDFAAGRTPAVPEAHRGAAVREGWIHVR